ncbi:MAG: MFS transporter [Coriobacteriales bacterium]|jgi:sugar phosphate permease
MVTQKYAWVIGAMCFLTGISTMIGSMIYAYSMTSMAAEFGITLADMAIVSSIIPIFCNGLAFVSGMISQQVGVRFTMGFAMLGGAIMTVLTGLFVENLLMLCIFSAIGGAFSSALIGSVLPRLVSNWFSPAYRAKAMMLYTLGPTVAGVILGIVVPIILNGGGWRFLYEMMGVILIVIALLFLFFVRNTPQEMGTIPLGYSEEEAKALADTAAVTDTAGGGTMLKKVLKNKMTWIFGIIYTIWIMNFSAGNTYGTSSMMSIGIDTTIVGLLNSMTMVIALISNILFASLSDKFLSRKFWLSILCIASGLIGFVTYRILCTPIDQLSIPLLFVVSGIGAFTMGTGPIINTINAEVFPPSQRAVGPAFVATLCIIGGVVGPLVSAQFIRMFNNFAPSYMLFSCSVIIIAGILFYIFIPKTGGKYGDPMAEKEVQEILGKNPAAAVQAEPAVATAGAAAGSAVASEAAAAPAAAEEVDASPEPAVEPGVESETAVPDEGAESGDAATPGGGSDDA